MNGRREWDSFSSFLVENVESKSGESGAKGRVRAAEESGLHYRTLEAGGSCGVRGVRASTSTRDRASTLAEKGRGGDNADQWVSLMLGHGLKMAFYDIT